MLRVIEDLAGDWRRLDERIEGLSSEIEVLARQDKGCERLMTMPRIGPIIASAIVAAIGTGDAFSKGRDFSAWLGLVPKQISTGDRTILGSISKRGNRYLRTLFVQAAWVVFHNVLALLGAFLLMVEHSRRPRFKPRDLQRELPLTRRGLRENQKRDGGSVFPAHANPGDPNGPIEA
jgi:transposase